MSDEMTPLEMKQQRAQSALNLKHERERTIATLVFPKRKTGEMNRLFAYAKSSSALLEVFDVQADPHALADHVKDGFNETIALLGAVISKAAADAAAKAAKAAKD